jgi:ABC-type multidrug transport system fused ATPase/permease subunit
MQPSEPTREPSKGTAEETKPTNATSEKEERERLFSFSSVANVPALLTALGVALYGLVNIGYSTYYGQLGLDPDDVGLDYASTLRRTTFLVLIALMIILAAVISYIQRTSRRLAESQSALEIEHTAAVNTEYLAVLEQQLEERRDQRDSLGPKERVEKLELSMDIMNLENDIRGLRFEVAEQEISARKARSRVLEEQLQAAQRQSAVTRRLLFRALAIALILLVAIVVLRYYCRSKAEDVKNGQAVAPTAVLGLTVLAIEAIPAMVQPIGDTTNSVILSNLAGKPLLYLGRADGNLVLYEEGRGALHIPASSVVLVMTDDSGH